MVMNGLVTSAIWTDQKGSSIVRSLYKGCRLKSRQMFKFCFSLSLVLCTGCSPGERYQNYDISFSLPAHKPSYLPEEQQDISVPEHARGSQHTRDPKAHVCQQENMFHTTVHWPPNEHAQIEFHGGL